MIRQHVKIVNKRFEFIFHSLIATYLFALDSNGPSFVAESDGLIGLLHRTTFFPHRVLVSAPHMLFALAVANYADAVKSYIKRRHT